MSDIIYISNARISFPNLIEPQRNKDPVTGVERVSYNCDLLMAPDHPGLAQFMQRYGALAQAQWKEHAGTVMQMAAADRKLRCYGDGNSKVNGKTFQPYDGYANMAYISAGSKNPPQMIQADGVPIDPTNSMAYQALARKLYGGCRVNAAIKPWLQIANPQKKTGNGVRCDLIALQFLADDTAFGAGSADVTGLFGQVAQSAAAPAAPVAMPGLPFAAPGVPPFMQGR